MKILIRFLILSFCASLISCEKTIDVDLQTAEPKLVIDASIDWTKGTTGNEQKIRLSTTTDYYNPAFPTVSGATIFITNTANTVFNFVASTKAGEYVCSNFVPVIGDTYTLTVKLNGSTYTAVETLIGVPQIESNITQTATGGMTGDEMEIQFFYQDDGTKDNYYMAGITSTHVAFTEYSLESDEMYQGKMMFQFYSHEDLKAGAPLNIKLYGISKRFFDFFGKTLLASGDDTGPFPATPAKVRGNIVNQTDAKNYALGYFRLSEVVTRDYIVK